MKMKNEQELLSVKDTAELLGVSPSTVRKWANLEEIQTVYDKQTGNRMFRKHEVLRLKAQLQNTDSNPSYIGFGIDMVNKFSNSFYGRLLKYSFVTICVSTLFFGIYIIFNLQYEIKTLKQDLSSNYKVVDFNENTNNRSALLQQDSIEKVLSVDQDSTNSKKSSYGKLILNIDDNLLSILEKSQITLDKQTELKVDQSHLQDLNNQQILAEFLVSSSTKIVNKSTMRDSITGKIYCVSVNNGKLVTVEGPCQD